MVDTKDWKKEEELAQAEKMRLFVKGIEEFVLESQESQRGRFESSEEVLNLAYYLDYLERETSDHEFGFWGLFCSLFGVPDVNFGNRKKLSFKEVNFEISNRKLKFKSTDSDRWRGVLKWLEAYLKTQVFKNKRHPNQIIQSIKSNQIDSLNDLTAKNGHGLFSISLNSGFGNLQNQNLHASHSQVEDALSYLKGQDKYTKETFIGAFAFAVFSESEDCKVHRIFEKVSKAKDMVNCNADNLLFFILVRLFYEIRTKSPITDFSVEIKELKVVPQECVWLLGQFLVKDD